MHCPNCKSALMIKDEEARCEGCALSFHCQDGIWDMLPRELPEWKTHEAEYHSDFEADVWDTHQLGRYRNRWAHKIIHNALRALPRGARVLEVGCGVGYDAAVLVKAGLQVTATDISMGTLVRARKDIEPHGRAAYVVADADHLPFAGQSFDAVFINASLHHLPDPRTALREMARVARPHGLVIAGIEPNRFWHIFIQRFRPALCRATHTPEHGGSIADEKLEGFTRGGLVHAFESCGIRIERVIPVWFLTGLLHYGLEFLHRAFRLRHRIKTPDWMDWIFLNLDRALFLIPGLDRLCWHWTVIGKKTL